MLIRQHKISIKGWTNNNNNNDNNKNADVIKPTQNKSKVKTNSDVNNTK